MLSRSRNNERAVPVLLRGILDQTVVVVDLQWGDYARARQLVETYSDLGLSFVDAAVIAVAERLEETTIATLDRRHFSVVKPLHCERFSIVP